MLLLLSSIALAAKPNILLIVADDLGYNDTQLYDAQGVDVPHLEKLADNGVLMNQGYVTSATCSPSRAGMMTGKYQQRFGFEFNIGPDPDNERGLPVDQQTMANYLHNAGYQTALVGKWHLGSAQEYYPTNRGFDRFWGILPGGTSYMDPSSSKQVTVSPPPVQMYQFTPTGLEPVMNVVPPAKPRSPGGQVLTGTWPGEVVENEDTYLTEALAKEAARIIKKSDGPWFVALTFTAPHSPLQSLTRFVPDDERPEYQRIYEGMITALDKGVGHVLKTVSKDTLVVFTSDNGCATYESVCDCSPARGGKACHLEGGVRVPFLIGWRGELTAGTFDHPVSTLDLLPTFLAAAEAPIPEGLDGVNLLPYLKGENTDAPHTELYWRTGVQKTVRKGKWKLRVNPDYTIPNVGPQGGTVLNDLEADPLEEVDVSAENPEVVAQLEADLAAWEATLEPPLWPARSNRIWDQCGSWLPFTP